MTSLEATGPDPAQDSKKQTSSSDNQDNVTASMEQERQYSIKSPHLHNEDRAADVKCPINDPLCIGPSAALPIDLRVRRVSAIIKSTDPPMIEEKDDDPEWNSPFLANPTAEYLGTRNPMADRVLPNSPKVLSCSSMIKNNKNDIDSRIMEEVEDDDTNSNPPPCLGADLPTNPDVENLDDQNPVADDVLVTDVTVNSVSVTIRECKTWKGFFGNRYE